MSATRRSRPPQAARRAGFWKLVSRVFTTQPPASLFDAWTAFARKVRSHVDDADRKTLSRGRHLVSDQVNGLSSALGP
jgi:hypothetical protein